MDNEEMSSSAPATKGDVARVRYDFARALLATEARLERRIDRLEAVVKTSHSEIMKRMDAFMARTVKIERDQIILIHRVDRLEKRRPS